MEEAKESRNLLVAHLILPGWVPTELLQARDLAEELVRKGREWNLDGESGDDAGSSDHVQEGQMSQK